MTLPLPYQIQDESVQGNFDELKKRFPLSRKDLKLETPHNVGDPGEPAFQNSWVNFDTANWQQLRFWRDPLDNVHVQGLIKSGFLGTTVFVLPTGYRPAVAPPPFAVDTNTGFGRVDVAATGNVSPFSGGTG
ncbi:MAG: hypothetical protein ACREBC_31365, partial [Pyrinomonadaceae bacterium]